MERSNAALQVPFPQTGPHPECVLSGGRGDVAQASKPAVSQVSKPAACPRCKKPSECPTVSPLKA